MITLIEAPLHRAESEVDLAKIAQFHLQEAVRLTKPARSRIFRLLLQKRRPELFLLCFRVFLQTSNIDRELLLERLGFFRIPGG